MDEHAVALRFSAQGIERMILHLELDPGIRRIEDAWNRFQSQQVKGI
ncbi:MAG: hypothetical protein ACLFUV_05600 [Methanomassiliicoccales archaeon]